MAHPAVRFALAVVAGVIAASLTIMGVEGIGHALFPPPRGAQPGDVQQLMLAAALAWFLGTLIGAIVAMRIARRVLPGWIVGLIIAGLSVLNTQMFPHPAWMVASALALPLIAVVVAKGVMRRHLASLEVRTER